MLDAVGKIVTEIRDDANVMAWTTRVRGGEQLPSVYDSTGRLVTEGDARGPGKYVRHIVVTKVDGPPDPDVPIQFVTLWVYVYGLTYADAADGYGRVSAAIHAKGPRLYANGLAIYRSDDETGGSQEADPDTDQPIYRGDISLIATTQAVTP